MLGGLSTNSYHDCNFIIIIITSIMKLVIAGKLHLIFDPHNNPPLCFSQNYPVGVRQSEKKIVMLLSQSVLQVAHKQAVHGRCSSHSTGATALLEIFLLFADCDEKCLCRRPAGIAADSN